MQLFRNLAAAVALAMFVPTPVAMAQAAPEPTPTAEPVALAPDAVAVSPLAEPQSEDVAAAPTATRSVFEQKLASRLAISQIDIEQIWLPNGAGTFLALHRPANVPIPAGGLVITTAPGGIVDGSPVHRHIAESAALGGWSVVSIQQVSADLAEAEAVSRIDAAIAYLTELGIENIVLVSDALGVPATIECIANNEGLKIAGLVVLGQWSDSLEGLTVSILDIAGSRDLAALRAQQVRKAQARDYPRPIERLMIDGAGPKFYGYEAPVAARVRGWLKRAAPGLVVHR